MSRIQLQVKPTSGNWLLKGIEVFWNPFQVQFKPFSKSLIPIISNPCYLYSKTFVHDFQLLCEDNL